MVANEFDAGDGGGERQRLAPEGGKEEHVFFQQRHDIAAAGDGRDRHAVRHGLGKQAQVGPHPEVLLGASERAAESGPHLIEDQQRTVAIADRPQLGEKSVLFVLEDKGFQDHAGRIAVDGTYDRVEIVIVERVGELRGAGRDPGVAIGDRDVPIVPAVIAAAEHLLAARIGARQAHRGAGDITPGLGETHRLGVRDARAHELG